MASSPTPQDRAREFLATAHLYHLGRLPTESSHPQTQNLSDLLKSDLNQAIRLLQRIDLQALAKFQTYLGEIPKMAKAISDTLQSGSRVFLCGCGATGRLALSLEYLWRRTYPADPDRVVAFMAGGDVALVHSLEGFEDYPEYGAEQLRELGFREGDLLISSTEGGETPFVIGATEEALRLSTRNPFFLYCNPRDVLIDHVERSKRVLTHPRIQSLSLFVGPMALAGSTRMQASTVLQLAIGMALFERENLRELGNRFGGWVDHYRELNLSSMQPFTEGEAGHYLKGDRVLYAVEDLAITVFTDTTERSPTFSLPAFNNRVLPRPEHSLAYVMIPSAADSGSAWNKLLSRPPRVLNWPKRNARTTMEYLLGFDFGQGAESYRKSVLPEVQHKRFSILQDGEQIHWVLENREWKWKVFGRGALYDHLLLKMTLNIHSTLLMGLLGRFESNFMTYVMPTNGKLVDRAARYVKWLLTNRGQSLPSDEELVFELFQQLDRLGNGESVVLKTAQVFSR